MTNELKIYPSSSGFMFGKSYEVDYNSACFRYLVVSQGIKKDIDPKYQELGKQHEDWYAEFRKEDILYQEKPIVKYYDNIKYSGRIDFIMKNGEIHETKASISKSFLYSVVRKKEVKLSHLAQLVSYLVHTKSVKGKIIAGYYKLIAKDSNVLTLSEYTEFLVEINDLGEILVNGIKFRYSVKDSITYLLTLVNMLKTEEIGIRPTSKNTWSNPCTYCPLLPLCDSFDAGSLSKEEYKTKSKLKLKEVSNG